MKELTIKRRGHTMKKLKDLVEKYKKRASFQKQKCKSCV